MVLGVNKSGKVNSTHGGNEMYINAAQIQTEPKNNSSTENVLEFDI